MSEMFRRFRMAVGRPGIKVDCECRVSDHHMPKGYCVRSAGVEARHYTLEAYGHGKPALCLECRRHQPR